MSMINTQHVAQNPFVEMERAPFAFHLTGSRFFGYEQTDSDWDFFVEAQLNPDNLSGWLSANDFRQEFGGTHYDSTEDVMSIWKHESVPIHIQFVQDANLKSAVQNAILLSNSGSLLYGMPKEEHGMFWSFAFRLYREIQPR